MFIQNYFLCFLFFICHNIKSHIICSRCKFNVTSEFVLENQESSVALSSKISSVFYNRDVLLNTFKNPHNSYFQVVTFKDAIISCDNENYEENSFFPGYSWSMCICPSCMNHLGWKFKPIINHCINKNIKHCSNNKPFYGLIKDKLKHMVDEELEKGERVEL